MGAPADSTELRQVLDRFVCAYLADSDSILSVRALSDSQGPYLAVGASAGYGAIPENFDGIRVIVTEREPGAVAAGPLLR